MDIDGQIISGDWLEERKSGGAGTFTLQVQDGGNRLYGFWTDEDGEKMDWVLEKQTA
jgi:hypothetical protein